jgi:hypothetical protein
MQPDRKCGLCEFASADMTAFTEHMRTVHDWGRRESPKGGRRLGTGEVIVGLCVAALAAAAAFWGLGNYVQNCRVTSPTFAKTYCDLFWVSLPFVVLAAATLGFLLVIFVLRRMTSARPADPGPRT